MDATHLAPDWVPDRTKPTRYIVLHRVLWPVDSGSYAHYGVTPTAEGVAEFYGLDLTHDGKPPMRPPYHLTITPAGDVEQTYRLSQRGAHAAALNQESIGIAVIGDPRCRPVPRAQWYSLIDLLVIVSGLYPDAKIGGHTSVPGATASRGKVCPGRYLDAKMVCRDVALARQREGEIERLVGVCHPDPHERAGAAGLVV